jgi:hypothetical protein
MAIYTTTIRPTAPRDEFTKGENVQNNTSAFNGSINSIPTHNVDGQKVAYAGAVTKLLPIIIRNAPSIWQFAVAASALAGSIIAKNWDSIATASNEFLKIISEQPDILRQYLASEFSKNVSPKDRAALGQILSQISQAGFEKAGTANPIPLAPLQKPRDVMQANAVQDRSKAVQDRSKAVRDRIDQINRELARLENSGASNNTPQTQAKIAKLKAEIKSLTQSPARAMSQTGSANVLQMSQGGGGKDGTGDIGNKTDGSNGGGKPPPKRREKSPPPKLKDKTIKQDPKENLTPEELALSAKNARIRAANEALLYQRVRPAKSIAADPADPKILEVTRVASEISGEFYFRFRLPNGKLGPLVVKFKTSGGSTVQQEMPPAIQEMFRVTN